MRWFFLGLMLAIVAGYAVAGKVPYRLPFDPVFSCRYVRRDAEPVRFWAIICLALFVVGLIWMTN